MRAIVLIEGDFNYYNKMVFTQHMLTSAQDKRKNPGRMLCEEGKQLRKCSDDKDNVL